MRAEDFMRRSGGVKPVWVFAALLWAAAAHAADKEVIGWLERVHIGETNIQLEAKIDTGADSSSLKAKILKTFVREGEEWVRFRLTDWHDNTVVMERRLVRYVRIKRTLAPSLKRPVVMLGICLGHHYREIEVNLAKRKRFRYQMLIGRDFLRGFYLVDSAQSHTLRPSCPGIKTD